MLGGVGSAGRTICEILDVGHIDGASFVKLKMTNIMISMIVNKQVVTAICFLY